MTVSMTEDRWQRSRTANRRPLAPGIGRDGSPNRPFAGGDAELVRDNGGLGEPALPKACSPANHPVSGFPLSGHHPANCNLNLKPEIISVLGRDGSPNRPFADGDAELVRDNGGLGEPALPKGSFSQSSGLRFPFGFISATKKDSTWCCPYPYYPALALALALLQPTFSLIAASI